MKTSNTIFKKGSTTFYYSSLLFPGDVKKDITALYAFVRTADDYVDAIPQQTTQFYEFRRHTEQALGGNPTNNSIIDTFCRRAAELSIPNSWILAFLHSMEQDLTVTRYDTYDDLEHYIYGSAEVIGLMLARILSLPDKSLPYARLLGKSLQLLNFIRDIREDRELGRVYIPQEDLSRYSIDFASLVRFELSRYYNIQQKAESGYAYIPKKYLVPIKTAADMYLWTADRISAHPEVVLTKKLKPTPGRIIMQLLINTISL